MLDVKCNAEIKHLNCRKEVHGEENVFANDVKLMLLGVPVDRLGSLCPDMGKHFYDGDVVAVGEVNPLTVGHKIENLKVKIEKESLNGVDLKKGAKIHLQPNKLANVECSIQVADISDSTFAELRRLYLEGAAMVVITERQQTLSAVQ